MKELRLLFISQVIHVYFDIPRASLLTLTCVPPLLIPCSPALYFCLFLSLLGCFVSAFLIALSFMASLASKGLFILQNDCHLVRYLFVFFLFSYSFLHTTLPRGKKGLGSMKTPPFGSFSPGNVVDSGVSCFYVAFLSHARARVNLLCPSFIHGCIFLYVAFERSRLR